MARITDVSVIESYVFSRDQVELIALGNDFSHKRGSVCPCKAICAMSILPVV